ncbi:glycosyltransferase family 2 protein [bacterium]|jgi:O-antigen biosynthesis protein|nr:glycosyltransferase family 2 protein [bacterium]
MISVILPNFNGEALFKAHLNDTFLFFKSMGITDIIIVDDASTDNSVTYLKETFPEINVLVNKKNQGFSYTCNKGAKEAKESILLFLNTDMLPQKLNLEFILNQFKDPSLFALSPKIERKDKSGIIINEAITTGYFKGGWFSSEVTPDYENHKNTSPFQILWACGGACFINKEKFVTLSGFDTAFSPFYCEDLDLSYRAWKQGWQILYTSETSFFHQHQATIGSYFSKKQIEQIHDANLYIFMWKNLSYPPFVLSHIFTVLLKIVTIQLRDIKAIIRAAKKIPYILKYRISNSTSQSDPAILKKWSSYYRK